MIRPSLDDTLFPVNRPHPCKPAAWNVIIGDYYYEYHYNLIANQVASVHARKWIGFTYIRRHDAIALGLLKKSSGTYVNGAIIVMLYIHSFD